MQFINDGKKSRLSKALFNVFFVEGSFIVISVYALLVRNVVLGTICFIIHLIFARMETLSLRLCRIEDFLSRLV